MMMASSGLILQGIITRLEDMNWLDGVMTEKEKEHSCLHAGIDDQMGRCILPEAAASIYEYHWLQPMVLHGVHMLRKRWTTKEPAITVAQVHHYVIHVNGSVDIAMNIRSVVARFRAIEMCITRVTKSAKFLLKRVLRVRTFLILFGVFILWATAGSTIRIHLSNNSLDMLMVKYILSFWCQLFVLKCERLIIFAIL